MKCLLAALLVPTCALAHANLKAATPAAGSIVRTAPATLELTFTERLEPQFCTVAVTDASGSPVSDGGLKADPADAERLIVPVKGLKPGRYTVTWHATSVDTHKTQGHYQFTVAP